LAEHDDAVRLGVGEGFEDEGVDEAEYDRVAGDSESARDDGAEADDTPFP